MSQSPTERLTSGRRYRLTDGPTPSTWTVTDRTTGKPAMIRVYHGNPTSAEGLPYSLASRICHALNSPSPVATIAVV